MHIFREDIFVGMTDECCGTIFGYCTGIPNNRGQEPSEDIEIIIADRRN